MGRRTGARTPELDGLQLRWGEALVCLSRSGLRLESSDPVRAWALLPVPSLLRSCLREPAGERDEPCSSPGAGDTARTAYTAGCGDIDLCTPCICERLSTPSAEGYARIMLRGSITLKTAVGAQPDGSGRGPGSNSSGPCILSAVVESTGRARQTGSGPGPKQDRKKLYGRRAPLSAKRARTVARASPRRTRREPASARTGHNKPRRCHDTYGP